MRDFWPSILRGILACGFAAGFAAQAATSPIEEAQSTLREWVSTRQLISKTKADWQADKETIGQTMALLERELKAVDEKMAALSTNSAQAEKERLEAQELLDSSNQALEGIHEFAAKFQAEMTQVGPRLPVPLQEIIKPMLNNLPAESSTNTQISASKRIQVLVQILGEFDKFNNGITLFSENRKKESGEEVSVETVYVGLGAAYFVNEGGDFAGMGTPGASGWEWTTRSELAGKVREMIRIYKNERGARFIGLPVAIR